MILVKPSAELLYVTPNPLQFIEAAGRTCYKSEDRITPDSATRFVRNILKRGHESVIEHATASVRFICDRGVSHEIVRHRLVSYSQESTRYCDYAKSTETGISHVTFIIPPWVPIQETIFEEVLELDEYRKQTEAGFFPEAAYSWLDAMWHAEWAYHSLREQGWKPEQARSVLPNSLKTELVMTCNLREFRWFFKMRCAEQAHPQMRELTVPLLKAFQEKIAVIFDDIQGPVPIQVLEGMNKAG